MKIMRRSGVAPLVGFGSFAYLYEIVILMIEITESNNFPAFFKILRQRTNKSINIQKVYQAMFPLKKKSE